MSVKYAFHNGTEKLFGTTYEFGDRLEKEQFLSALQAILSSSVIAGLGSSSLPSKPFNPAEAEAWLAASGVASAHIARGRASFPEAFIPAPVAPPKPREQRPQKPKIEPRGATSTSETQKATSQPLTVRIFAGKELVCGTALKFATEAERDTIIRVLKTATFHRLDVKPCLQCESASQYHGGLLADWLYGRQDINAEWVSNQLVLPLSSAERAAKQLRQDAERQRKAEQERRDKAILAEAKLRQQEAAQKFQARTAALAAQKRLEDERQRQLSIDVQRQQREAIRQVVLQRGIKQLTHFTRIENLTSILQNGLVGRHLLPPNAVKNDHNRWDNRPHAICLSVSFPNFFTFDKFRRDGDFAVLLLKPEIMWELSCGFTPCNATKAEVRYHNDRILKDVEWLEKMFRDPELRRLRGLEDHEATDFQAEVLVFDKIPPEYIQSIHVQPGLAGYQSVLAHARAVGFQVECDPTYFRYRNHWMTDSL